ncbi:TetR/AcrR family transcriptional regulator [Amycolatopsis alkalitolerans]|uniref:TetR/AcrR family transcriptional regulator n=1 Tax=Amycolatopsis alkalitolerans TaxID=2547244 RepID=A0A5C4LXV9_9PSEU|nr:TetR/AcrR family transcriptional regulator [Amycolatopsis alkalitolerans]TNC24529.1 TetR/AcrR family transcriptional regulator [Amycolatopsis alkalitolerans]
MSIQARRERERAEREKLIVTAARELAEAEGWDAVTTRRLAEQVEYSQPVLYSHFKGKGAIVAAVAVEGFAELAGQMHAARAEAADAGAALEAVARAYLAFADRHPALYDAMFSQSVELPFATPHAPLALHAGFNELAEVVQPQTTADDVGVLAETFWAALHGLVTLTRGGRLPREASDERLALLLARFGAR